MIAAAEYLRVSTEHQQYSLDNQRQAIAAFAQRNGLTIVASFEDAGRSGLHLSGRPGLQSMLAEIASGAAPYEAILVYDVSRWGRFQNVDESAAHEFRCLQHGVQVLYCAEPFPNDGTIASALMKAIKRVMAAEQSRALSAKVFEGQKRLAGLGFRQGGMAGYGLRRELIDRIGETRRILELGQRKALQTDRVALALGPQNEIAVVRWIFSTYAAGKASQTQIAGSLNTRGIPNFRGGAWSVSAVSRLLRNEKYRGDSVWNRSSFKLKARHTQNAEGEIVRKADAFPAIIDDELFAAVQRRRKRWGGAAVSDEGLLEELRQLLIEHHKLSVKIVDRFGPRSSAVYKKRFGGMGSAYQLLGYGADARHLGAQRRAKRRKIKNEVIACLRDVCDRNQVTFKNNGSDVELGDAISLLVQLATACPGSSQAWQCRTTGRQAASLMLVVKLDADDETISGYLVGATNALRGRATFVVDRSVPSIDVPLTPVALEQLVSWASIREASEA